MPRSLWGGMEQMHWSERFKISAGLSLVFGLFIGLAEHLWLGLVHTQPLAWLDAFVLGLVLMGTMCAVSIASSLFILPMHRQTPGHGGGAAAAMLLHVVFGIASLCVWQAFHSIVSAMLVGDYRFVAGLLLMTSLVGALLTRNLSVWFRVLSQRRTPLRSLAFYGVGIALLLLVVSSSVWAYRGLGGGFALEDDRTVLVISIDGWDLEMGRPERLGEDWTFFGQAVNPSPSLDSAHVSMFTGLHPLRHGVGVSPQLYSVIPQEDTVAQQVPILAEMLGAEGYTTGGFVSSVDLLRRTGLDRGFGTYDDDVGGWLPGLRLTSLHRWGRLFGEELELEPSVRTRSLEATADGAAQWMEQADGSPWFLWVHLSGAGGDGAGAVEVATSLTEAALEATNGDVLVVWMGSPTSAEGGTPLSESQIRLPIAVHASWLDDVQREVNAQIRPMDVQATILDAVGVRAVGPNEGVSLLPYMRGEDSASLWCSLVTQDSDGQWWLGLRNDRVKYVEDPFGTHTLYDLQQDPNAERDVSAEQASVVIRAQDVLAPERKALTRWQEKS